MAQGKNQVNKGHSRSEMRSKRSEAAKRGWETRRKNATKRG
jgi:hypothetical protein